MNASLSRSLTGLACVALVGCSMFGSKKAEDADYRVDGSSQENRSSLAVPPDLITPSRDPRFAYQDFGKSSATYSAYARDGARTAEGAETVVPKFSKVRVERAGSQRWLVVPGTPDSVWPQLRQFWQDNGFQIKVDTPELGIMETEWAENKAKLPLGGIRGFLGKTLGTLYSTGEMDKFRTRVEKSSETGQVEVYISHRGMEEVSIDRETRWQPRPVDPDLEVQFMRRFAASLGVEKQLAKQVVPDAGSKEAVQVARAFLMDGGERLEVDGAIDRVWRQVGLALDRVGVVVEDRDRGSNTYFVRYLDTREDPKTGKSWWSKLAFWEKNEKGTDQFRVVLEAIDDGATEIYVLTRDGDEAPEDATREILNLLYDELK
jgi:outer membrane protein assembly factor BamC